MSAQPEQLVVGCFGNQWARSKEGKWSRLTEATFTHDSVPTKTKFHREPTGKAPEIDWEALKRL